MNFLNLPETASHYEQASYVVLPAPFEKTVSYGSGTAQGPQAILSASAQVEFYDEELKSEACFTKGIATLETLSFNDLDEQGACKRIYQATSQILADQKIPILLGGEHTISYGSIQAAYEKYPNLHVVQIDAHSDLREEYEGNPWSHASVMKRVYDLGVPIHGVGIRAQCKKEAQLIQESDQLHICYDFERRQNPHWIASFLNEIPQEVPIYFTIDVDGLDPAIMPSTGTPVPGGLSWSDTLQFTQALLQNRRLVAFDLVELAPQEGNQAPDFLAAQLIYKVISYNEAS